MLDPGAAERLRAAIGRQQSVGGDRYRDPATLDALVAPVALYPDALLEQVLAAATYPDQVRAAGRILEDAPDLSRSELEDELAERDWDPSVLTLLSDFPTVIGRMAADMTWTSQLGGAVVDQNGDVLAAVQRQRSRAYAAGNLVSGGPQVVTRSADRIIITPARSGTLYAPTYDPRAVYTIPNAPPPAGGCGLAPSPLVAGALAFGTALLIGELTKSDHDDRDRSDRRRRDDRDHRAPRERPGDWRDRPVIYPGPDFRGFERLDEDRDAARAAERRRERAEEERQEARQARRREEARKEARDDRRKSERREEARKERKKANRAEEARQEKQREARAEEARRDRRKAERSEEARKEKRREERGKENRREERGKDRKAERRPEGERPRAERRGEDDRRKAQREARQPNRERSESRGEERKKARKECREDDRECRRR